MSRIWYDGMAHYSVGWFTQQGQKEPCNYYQRFGELNYDRTQLAICQSKQGVTRCDFSKGNTEWNWSESIFGIGLLAVPVWARFLLVETATDRTPYRRLCRFGRMPTQSTFPCLDRGSNLKSHPQCSCRVWNGIPQSDYSDWLSGKIVQERRQMCLWSLSKIFPY